MKFGKNQVIKFEQNLCNAKVDDNEVLFVRVSDVVQSKEAMLEVPFTHNAIVIKGGGDLRYYTSGPHKLLETKQEIKDWKNNLSVEVVYIPKDTRAQIFWGTPSRVNFRDKESNHVISVGAHGEADICVTNPEMFVRKVVGATKEFDKEKFAERFGLTIANKFGKIFLDVVEEKGLTYDQFDKNKDVIETAMCKVLDEMFKAEWGLSVSHFLIKEFKLLDEDKNVIESAAAEKRREDREKEKEREERERIKEYLAEIERLDDKQWEREKYLKNLEMHDKEAYYEVLKIVGHPTTAAPKEPLRCPDCGNEYSPNVKFCPNCGKKLTHDPIVCPDCGKTNPWDVKFCGNCGKKLTNN